MPTLLLIDDDLRLAGMVADYLGQAGFGVHHAASVAQARQRLVRERPDAILMDVMLPDGDGLALTAELRQAPQWQGVPILMLTARGDSADRILGLEIGADDYLPKPFEPRELLARIRALLRRSRSEGASPSLKVGALELDLGARVARLHDRPLDLTGHQFDILHGLARHAGRVLSRDQIMEGLRGQSLDAYDRSIDVHISRIRAVLEDDPRSPKRLLTVRGIGYLLARLPDGDAVSPKAPISESAPSARDRVQ